MNLTDGLWWSEPNVAATLALEGPLFVITRLNFSTPMPESLPQY